MSSIYEVSGNAAELVEAARRIAHDIARPASGEVDAQGEFPAAALAALAEEGFYGLCLPSECGGHAQPPRVFAAVVEELAGSCASTAMVYVMHVSASQAIAASNRLAARTQILQQITGGKHLTTLAISERGSRSQFWAPVSKLEENGAAGEYFTRAEKSWVTSANHADSYVASAQKPNADSPLESTLYLVNREADGVRVTGEFRGMGLRGNDSAPVEIAAAVAAGDLLTEQGEGATMMLEVVLPWFVIGTAAMAVGLCREAVDATMQHLSTTGFAHDGTKLRDLPNLRARLAEMSVRTEQSRALLALAARRMETPDETTPLLVLQARLSAVESALEVTDLAMKACGGAAFSKQLGVERLFRDARAGWVMAPTADHLREFIGRGLTGLPLF